MRWLLVLAGLAAVAVGLMIFLVVDSGPEPQTRPAPALPAAQPEEPGDSGPVRRYAPDPVHDAKAPRHKKRPEAKAPLDEKTVEHFGQEFERKWYADRERLGRERHAEMEELWFKGRRPRGTRASIERLEKILADFPDTNRAGCAALELGHHYLRNRDLDAQARRKKAEEYWHMAEQRYRDTLCEYNAPAAGLAKVALASWVYRSSDPAMARRVLEEVIAEHKGETDHLGKPLEETARRLLESLKP
ncbi:MAG: hypothetical protein JXR96_28310 [Deltaproteobacteria bacterium]|nr:hypothetical protein [Deltaproteobacteria bacterium]